MEVDSGKRLVFPDIAQTTFRTLCCGPIQGETHRHRAHVMQDARRPARRKQQSTQVHSVLRAGCGSDGKRRAGSHHRLITSVGPPDIRILMD